MTNDYTPQSRHLLATLPQRLAQINARNVAIDLRLDVPIRPFPKDGPLALNLSFYTYKSPGVSISIGELTETPERAIYRPYSTAELQSLSTELVNKKFPESLISILVRRECEDLGDFRPHFHVLVDGTVMYRADTPSYLIIDSQNPDIPFSITPLVKLF
ncbi:MAG: hypothetical protein AABX11_01025 [Nanoarchaeota archaeon]